jgi:hypothetical protein
MGGKSYHESYEKDHKQASKNLKSAGNLAASYHHNKAVEAHKAAKTAYADAYASFKYDNYTAAQNKKDRADALSNHADRLSEFAEKHVPLHIALKNNNKLDEGADGMSAAPATSDNPGWNGDTSKDASADNDSPSKDKQSTDSGSNEDVNTARDHLEVIATIAATLYENISDDQKLESWILEKLDLAKGFLDSISEAIGDGGNNEDDEKNQDADNYAKPTAFKGASAPSMTKEEAENKFNETGQNIKIKEIAKKLNKKTGQVKE